MDSVTALLQISAAGLFGFILLSEVVVEVKGARHISALHRSFIMSTPPHEQITYCSARHNGTGQNTPLK